MLRGCRWIGGLFRRDNERKILSAFHLTQKGGNLLVRTLYDLRLCHGHGYLHIRSSLLYHARMRHFPPKTENRRVASPPKRPRRCVSAEPVRYSTCAWTHI